MYRFVIESFGMGKVRRRKQRGSDATTLDVVEVETFDRFSRVVSIYRYEGGERAYGGATQHSEVGLCRYAVAQFLRRSETIHVARVEILDTTLPKFKGKLTSIPEQNHGAVKGFSTRHSTFNLGPSI
jgi:hypothetical protein